MKFIVALDVVQPDRVPIRHELIEEVFAIDRKADTFLACHRSHVTTMKQRVIDVVDWKGAEQCDRVVNVVLVVNVLNFVALHRLPNQPTSAAESTTTASTIAPRTSTRSSMFVIAASIPRRPPRRAREPRDSSRRSSG